MSDKEEFFTRFDETKRKLSELTTEDTIVVVPSFNIFEVLEEGREHNLNLIKYEPGDEDWVPYLIPYGHTRWWHRKLKEHVAKGILPRA